MIDFVDKEIASNISPMSSIIAQNLTWINLLAFGTLHTHRHVCVRLRSQACVYSFVYTCTYVIICLLTAKPNQKNEVVCKYCVLKFKCQSKCNRKIRTDRVNHGRSIQKLHKARRKFQTQLCEEVAHWLGALLTHHIKRTLI